MKRKKHGNSPISPAAPGKTQPPGAGNGGGKESEMKTVTVTFSGDKIAERTARTLRRRTNNANEEYMDARFQPHRYSPFAIDRLAALASIERVRKRGRSVVITVANGDGDAELLRAVATEAMHAAGVVGEVEYS